MRGRKELDALAATGAIAPHEARDRVHGLANNVVCLSGCERQAYPLLARHHRSFEQGFKPREVLGEWPIAMIWVDSHARHGDSWPGLTEVSSSPSNSGTGLAGVPYQDPDA